MSPLSTYTAICVELLDHGHLMKNICNDVMSSFFSISSIVSPENLPTFLPSPPLVPRLPVKGPFVVVQVDVHLHGLSRTIVPSK